MNAGIIASRYAKALLDYVQESGSGKEVYFQTCRLCYYMNQLPQFKEYLMDASDVSLEKKLSLLTSALELPLEPSLEQFLKMVTAHRRIEFFPRMLLSFIEQYRRQNNIKVGSMVTAAHSEGLCKRLETLFHNKTGAEIHLIEKVDPDIIGGFIFELDGLRLDASVVNHLNRLKRQLIEKNNRIV